MGWVYCISVWVGYFILCSGFLEGLFWLGALSYFAGAEKKDERVLVPDLGSLTSIYDRWVIEVKKLGFGVFLLNVCVCSMLVLFFA